MNHGKLTGLFVILALLTTSASAVDIMIYSRTPQSYGKSYGTTYYAPATYGYYSAPSYVQPNVIYSRSYSSFTTTLYNRGYTTYTPGFSTSTYIPNFTLNYGTPFHGYSSGSYYPHPFGYTQGYRHGFNDGFRNAQHETRPIRKKVTIGR